MEVSVFAITGWGAELARRIKREWEAGDRRIRLLVFGDHARPGEGEIRFDRNLTELAGEAFRGSGCLIFVGAAGIAVRAIAPHLENKKTDPAVLVVDEQGRHVISLLSGHAGGANRLAGDLARRIGAVPVITTASEVNGITALDEIALERGWTIADWEALKKVSAALLNGGRVAVMAEEQNWLQGLVLPPAAAIMPLATDLTGYQAGVAVSSRTGIPAFDVPVAVLRPRTLVAGIGCRRGTSVTNILQAVEQALTMADRCPQSLRYLATIDLKQDEPGLREAAGILGVELVIISRERILGIEDQFQLSDLVKTKTGVGAVCEPAAWLACARPRMLLPKTVIGGVTVSLCQDLDDIGKRNRL